MEVTKYKRKASLGWLADTHGMTQTIEEIWVEQADGKHFAFNSEGGIFFQDSLLTDGKCTQIQVDGSKIATMRRYLDIREGLIEELFED